MSVANISCDYVSVAVIAVTFIVKIMVQLVTELPHRMVIGDNNSDKMNSDTN